MRNAVPAGAALVAGTSFAQYTGGPFGTTGPTAPPLESPTGTQAASQIARGEQQTQQRQASVLPYVTLEETFTNNVNLQPSGSARSDWVTQITPGLQIDAQGAHAKIAGSIALPILIYARTGDENNRVVPQANLTGHWEAVERFFFVDAAAYSTQEFFTPFGARSPSLVNNPQNAYLTQVYTLSPYFQGTTPGGLQYELRNNSIWSNLSSTPIQAQNSYTNETIANLTRQALPLGWALNLYRSDVKFTGQDAEQVQELARVRGLDRIDAALEVSGSVGYEHNHFPFTDYNDFIYGVGGRWHPSDRTTVDANWEHRFFGSSYHVKFDHRTPLSVWTVEASRDTSSYPQLLAQLPGGSIVPLLLNSLFQARIPDPAQRAQFVTQFIRDQGLPLILGGPFTLYSQQVYLQERAQATAGLLGVRNTLFGTVYRQRVEPIAGTGSNIPALFELQDNNTQLGGGVVWTHRLTELTSLVVTGDYVRTTANAPLVGTTKQGTVRAIVSTPIGANTTVYAGVRYQALLSDLSENSHEAAAYAGITHTFR